MESTIGARIRQLRETKQLSVADFAKAAGVKPSAVYGLESGQSKPSLETVASLRQSFPGLNTEWLQFGDGEMFGRNLSQAPHATPTKQSEPIDGKAVEVPQPGKLIVTHSLSSMTDAQRAAWWQARYEQLHQEVERGANREATLIQLLGKNEASADAAVTNESRPECRIIPMPLEMPEFQRFRPTPPRRNAIGF